MRRFADGVIVARQTCEQELLILAF